ncbi:hypothetical protein SCMU_14250 [Sinomonas cyclohexanicum]|uniref:Uncharacterized protein n=1 Tax=Sinomonas cyclohexanicum TaxID=322009 RepID=A0ABM7PTL9_SINCY|nr:hypothetical protein SCMU_14250 [Corynebacterium cyclohexanicum]
MGGVRFEWLRDWWFGIVLLILFVALLVAIGFGSQAWEADSVRCLQANGFLHNSGFMGMGHQCLSAHDYHEITGY